MGRLHSRLLLACGFFRLFLYLTVPNKLSCSVLLDFNRSAKRIRSNLSPSCFKFNAINVIAAPLWRIFPPASSPTHARGYKKIMRWFNRIQVFSFSTSRVRASRRRKSRIPRRSTVSITQTINNTFAIVSFSDDLRHCRNHVSMVFHNNSIGWAQHDHA